MITNVELAKFIITRNGIGSVMSNDVRTVSRKIGNKSVSRSLEGFRQGIHYVHLLINAGSPIIGLVHEKDICSFPGETCCGYGYDGSGGEKWNDCFHSAFYEPFGKGDVIGMLIDCTDRTLSFTKNDALIGQAFDLKGFGSFYPAVGLHQGASVTWLDAARMKKKT
jgi:hypothetical protein